MTTSLQIRIQGIKDAHTWYRHSVSMFGSCRCGLIAKPITESEHGEHIAHMAREAAVNMANRILANIA